jgi:PPM family protein phosphatase
VAGWNALVVQIGDSRAYLFRKHVLSQLTRDQTLAQELIDRGAPAESTKGLRHVLTNSLGGKKGVVVPHVEHLRLREGDRILLCSDGLTERMPNQDIAERLKQNAAAQAACDALVQLALERGGRDNITAIVAQFDRAGASAAT